MWTRHRDQLISLFCFALLLLVPSLRAAAADPTTPDEAVAPTVSQAPVIDGDLSDAVWDRATRIDGFVDANTGGKPYRATWMKAVHDATHLYLAVWSEEPRPDKIKAVAVPEKNVWQDDCLEVFVRHSREPGEYIQLITNTRDVHEDYMNLLRDSPGKKWNSRWVTRTRVDAKAWATEMRIPLSELGIPGTPLHGDFILLRLGREIYSDYVEGDARHPTRLVMWPWASSYSGPFGYARLYLGGRNLVQNREFAGPRSSTGFPRPWNGTKHALDYYGVVREDGQPLFKVDASVGTREWLQQGLRVRPGDTYRVRAETRGDVRTMIQVRVPVPGERRTAPIVRYGSPSRDWQTIEFEFSSPGPNVSFSFYARDRASGKHAWFRNIEVVKQISGARPHYLTWNIKEPRPFQGLDALAARRFGIKPYELLEAKGCAGRERVVFKDSSTGTEMCLLTRDRANECHVYHNLVWCFSANGKWIEFAGDRPESGPRKHRRWAARTDGTAVVPLVLDGANYHWSAEDGDIHYQGIRGKSGWLAEYNLATGKRRKLAELGNWLRPWGIIARPGKGCDRLVVVNPDKRTGFTVKLDGSGRRDVVFESPDGGTVNELYFSKAHPNILYGRCPHIYRVEDDGGITQVCKTSDRAEHGYRNMFRPGHSDTSRSEQYAASPNGEVTGPDGRVEKVYDPSPLRKLGGFIGNNGYTSWGPTDDWFLMENGLHFVKVWRDGRAFQFLGFHQAISLDYYAMAWGQVSPDGTKIVSKTTLFDNTDMLMTIATRPLPTENVRAGADEISWQPPAQHAEIKGYHVYISQQSGGPYKCLNGEPIAELRWSGRGKSGAGGALSAGYYVVTAMDYAGVESPYSREVEVNVAGAAPARLFTEAELLEMVSPVVERREAGASNWHYVAQDPYVRQKQKRDGKLSWKCVVPRRLADRSFKLWARVRTTEEGKTGTAQILSGNKPAGVLAVSSSQWQWVCADRGELRADGETSEIEVSIVPRDGAFAVDMLALYSNPDERPEGRGNVDQTLPGAPKGLAAESTGDHETFLTWRPSPEADLAYYNVYASDDGKVTAAQRFLIGSPRQTKLVDWGLKTGTTYRYVVTAVDRAGNESPPSGAATVTTPRRDETVLILEAESARRSETGKGPSGVFASKDERCSGGAFVGCRIPGDAKLKMPERLKLPSKRTVLSWQIEVDKPGSYLVWLRMRSARRSADLEFSVDGKESVRQRITFGWWDARTQRLLWGDTNRAYCWFWTDVPLYRKLDTRPLRLDLTKGRHVFSIGNIWPGLDIDAVTLTSDLSWIPDGTINYF